MKIKSTLFATLIGTLCSASSAFAQATATPTADSGDTAWILTCTALVLMMSIPGLALFYGGLVRKDNVLATLMQTFIVVCVVSLLWPMIGYTIAFSEGNAWLGNLDKLFLAGVGPEALSGTIPESAFVLFQLTFAAISCAILLGSVADRIKFSSVIAFTSLWLILVYAPIAHWVWGGGALSTADVFGVGEALDFAGGTVVHISSGVAGLVAALVIGKSVTGPQSTSNNLVLSVIGASLLWVGWFGFNAGSALAAGASAGYAILVTNSAAAAAALIWVSLEWYQKGKPSVTGAISGAVAGLVGITPAAGFVDFGSSLFIGEASGLFCFVAVTYMKERLGYDDSLDVFGIHGIGGIVGALLTGIFASEAIGGSAGALEGNAGQFVAQLVSVVVTIIYSAVATLIILYVVRAIFGLRVGTDVERSGLDLALHGDEVHVYK